MTREELARLHCSMVAEVRNAEAWVQALVYNGYLLGMQKQLERSVEKCDASIQKHQDKMDEMKRQFEMDPVPARQNALWEFQALRDVAQRIKTSIKTEE